MVVLRPGNDEFDSSLITFGQLTKSESGYCAEILYDSEPLYYQFNDCNVNYDNSGERYVVTNLSKDYEYIEEAIQKRLAEESHNMFKRGFTEEMLVKMREQMEWNINCPLVSTYTKKGVKGCFIQGESDVIFQCCCVIFEQSSWKLVWKLIQIRQEQEDEVVVDPNYLFVDDEDEEDREDNNYHDTDNGYESDNEHTEDAFMFVPKPDNE